MLTKVQARDWTLFICNVSVTHIFYLITSAFKTYHMHLHVCIEFCICVNIILVYFCHDISFTVVLCEYKSAHSHEKTCCFYICEQRMHIPTD